MRLGVRFFGPMPEPPHRQPRMHNVLRIPSRTSITSAGMRGASAVEIRRGVRVTALITDRNRVIGVTAATVASSEHAAA